MEECWKLGQKPRLLVAAWGRTKGTAKAVSEGTCSVPRCEAESSRAEAGSPVRRWTSAREVRELATPVRGRSPMKRVVLAVCSSRATDESWTGSVLGTRARGSGEHFASEPANPVPRRDRRPPLHSPGRPPVQRDISTRASRWSCPLARAASGLPDFSKRATLRVQAQPGLPRPSRAHHDLAHHLCGVRRASFTDVSHSRRVLFTLLGVWADRSQWRCAMRCANNHAVVTDRPPERPLLSSRDQ
jgi:hypothetical protein